MSTLVKRRSLVAKRLALRKETGIPKPVAVGPEAVYFVSKSRKDSPITITQDSTKFVIVRRYRQQCS
jgi:hypothetical protein